MYVMQQYKPEDWAVYDEFYAKPAAARDGVALEIARVKCLQYHARSRANRRGLWDKVEERQYDDMCARLQWALEQLDPQDRKIYAKYP